MELSPLAKAFRPLTELATHLSKLGLTAQLRQPTIVLCGRLLAGKSLLLESLLGIDFLPTSENHVTLLTEFSWEEPVGH